MSAARVITRYAAAQIVEAVDRARGDGRYFLVSALLDLPAEHHADALERVLEMELRPDERQMVLARLARLRPTEYVPQLIRSSLRSRSINVQQMALAALPEVVGDGLPADLAAEVERWLRRRLANPQRRNTWAMWEIPGAALALLPSYGTDRIVALLTDLQSTMQPDERNTWLSLARVVDDSRAFEQGFVAWWQRNGPGSVQTDPRDPTAAVYVDRVMRRLGYRPANPDSQVYDSLA